MDEPAAPPSERERLVAEALELWRSRLIDLGRRNRMLYFSASTRSKRHLALDAPDPDALAKLLEGEKVAPIKLLPGRDEVELAAIMKTIERQTRIFIEEKGLHTLVIGAGMATWRSDGDGRAPNAPVLLLPARIEAATRGDFPYVLRVDPDEPARLNPVFVYALKHWFGLQIDEQRIREILEPPTGASASGDEPPPPDTTTTDLVLADTVLMRYHAVFAYIREACERVPDFAIHQRYILSNFQFQKMAMVRDLEEQAGLLAANDLVAAIAGVPEARAAVAPVNRAHPDPHTFDQDPLSEQQLILDADSSQEAVIRAVINGQSGVIQGPPGTGKSQTISNLVGALAASGKRVLFVAEKRAALEVVERRLQKVGLDHLALDLHDADVSKRAIIDQLKLGDERARLSGDAGAPAAIIPKLERLRAALNEHDGRVNTPLPGAPRNVFELQGTALSTPESQRAQTRWRRAELEAMPANAEERGREILREGGNYGPFFLDRGDSPWRGGRIEGPDDILRARDLVLQLAQEDLPPAMAATHALAETAGLPPPATLADAREMDALARPFTSLFERYDPAILSEDLEAHEKALGPAWGAVSRFFAGIFNGAYKRAKSTVAAHRHESASARTLLAEVKELREASAAWTDRFGAPPPRDPAAVGAATGALATFESSYAALAALAPAIDDPSLNFSALAAMLGQLQADQNSLNQLPHVRELRAAFGALGVARILQEFEERNKPPAEWPVMLSDALARSWLDLLLTSSGLGGFVPSIHEQAVSEFVALDKALIEVTPQRVRAEHAKRYIDARNKFTDQDGLIQREMQKKTRHVPIRQLLERAPDVLLSLAPCWMASPLSVSTLIPPGRPYFDVVLFDEASQVFPEDAIPVILRAEQWAVAGDPHQLPPTNFFSLADEGDAEEEAGAAEGFESILDNLLSLFGPWSLDWHYRSKDEKLIAFSNAEIYGGRLVTFPGPAALDSISHVAVQPDELDLADEKSVSAEVRRVVQLVLEHAERRPDETLGVIALGIEHANRIEAALEEARDLRRNVDDFFRPEGEEPFFVKNLERVQGDERDAIILSVGYGKDRAGHLRHNFGPINQKGGERRLNVAITRARRRMTVVSSFDHRDIDLSRTGAKGVAMLRGYLEYAAKGGTALTGVQLTGQSMNAFEADVHDALAARGYELIPQLGASGYRLDFAVKHPQRPGEFVLAIECDGATYHSAPTARDRDRLRQAHLERLGWSFYRIWSTDWFLNREHAISRACAAIDAAIAAADAQPEEPSEPEPAAQQVPQAFRDAFGDEQDPNLPVRGERPRFRAGRPIDDYPPRLLQAVVAWIQSDGLLRSDEEILQIARDELGYARTGSRIRAALTAAIAAARARGVIQ